MLKKSGDEVRIPITGIVSVSVSEAIFAHPARVTLNLAMPCKFGSKVSFSPKNEFFLLQSSASPIVKELKERIEVSRT